MLYEKYYNGSWRTETYHQALETLILLMAPIAPFITEELWHQAGNQGSVHLQDWPSWDPEIAADKVLQIPIQINGKKRALVEVESSASKSEVEEAAFESAKVQQYISGQKVAEVIYVPGKILNIRTE